MPAWSGGACPDCGDYMPPNLITCQTCRALLNSDLQLGLVDIPEFVPLQEISLEERSSNTSSIMAPPPQIRMQIPLLTPRGAYVKCPGCEQELKIPEQYAYARVSCNRCQTTFQLDRDTRRQQITACYLDCPHCGKRLRTGVEYTNQNVQCNHCSGALHVQFQY